MIEFVSMSSKMIYVFRGKSLIATLYDYGDEWVLDSISLGDYLTSDEIRKTADKLDQLNGTRSKD
jgi:hypothetical protein